MLHSINPLKTTSWRLIKDHSKIARKWHMRDLFENDPHRFNKYSVSFEEILLDYSKNIINSDTMKMLFALAREIDLSSGIESLFRGDAINRTENRPALHTVLRQCSSDPFYLGDRNITEDVNRVLLKIEKFSNSVYRGSRKGYTGKPITDIVTIGIGGSDLGPSMVKGSS